MLDSANRGEGPGGAGAGMGRRPPQRDQCSEDPEVSKWTRGVGHTRQSSGCQERWQAIRRPHGPCEVGLLLWVRWGHCRVSGRGGTRLDFKGHLCCCVGSRRRAKGRCRWCEEASAGPQHRSDGSYGPFPSTSDSPNRPCPSCSPRAHRGPVCGPALSLQHGRELSRDSPRAA